MIAVVQRVGHAEVKIEGEIAGAIGAGFLVLLGIAHEDSEEDALWLSGKITQLRVFSDAEGKMNLALQDNGGELLVISQFTLHASTKKGNRPSFINAAKPDHAIPLYEKFVGLCKNAIGEGKVKTGVFGADMKVSLMNDGPVTIIIDSKNRV